MKSKILAGTVLLALTSSGLLNAAPTTVADLGNLSGNTSVSGSLAPNEVQWYSFIVDSFTYLDITTSTADFDTEIGLYDSAGNLVASDDDNGFGLLSTLSFGTGSGQALGDPLNLGGDGIANGEDGPLAASMYYLAIGEFQVTFGATAFDVQSTGLDSGGSYTIDFYSDARNQPSEVPEPASLALLGIGLVGIGASRRRRKEKTSLS